MDSELAMWMYLKVKVTSRPNMMPTTVLPIRMPKKLPKALAPLESVTSCTQHTTQKHRLQG